MALNSQLRFSFNFRMKKRLKFGQAIYVSGDIDELGNWEISKAFRLQWNDKDIWTSNLVLGPGLPEKYEYKYFISFWEGPHPSNIIWQQGSHNRIIYPGMKYKNQIIDDKWNMDKISLNLMVPQNQDVYNKYSVIGNHIQLGNWKIPVLLTKRNKGSKLSLTQVDTDQDSWEDYNIYSYSFQIFRGRQKFRYYYVRQANYVCEGERHPGRLFTLGKQNISHPDYYKTVYSFGKIQLYQKCNFHLLVFSKVTDKIFLGAYPKTIEDITQLKSLGVNSILSIQTQDDFSRHNVSEQNFRSVCNKSKIEIEVCSIKDMDKEDFIQKAEGALQILKNWNSLDYFIYVHCSAGIYRSPQIVVMHLVSELNYDFQEALKLVKHKHIYANPNVQLIFNATQKIRSQKQITSATEIQFKEVNQSEYQQEKNDDQHNEQKVQVFEHH